MRSPEYWPWWEPFTAFAKRQLETRDYDPFHPMLWSLQRGMTKEEALWSSFIYMAFYSMGSSYCAWSSFEPLQKLPAQADGWHIGLQRRNLRASSVVKHIEDMSQKARPYGSIEGWLTDGFGSDLKQNWKILIARLESVWGNGRWAAYTTAELFQKANNLNVEPACMGLDGATGPRKGLIKLTGLPSSASLEELEAHGDALVEKLRELHPDPGIPWARHGYDYAMVESTLCDFYGLTQGRYYVGRDIDRIAGRIVAQQDRTDVDMAPVWGARAEMFPRYLLTEERKVTPTGVDWARAKVFKDHGVIADYRDDFMLM